MGAMLKLEGGNIMLHAPGKVEFKASQKELAGAASATAVLPRFTKSELILPKEKPRYSQQIDVLNLIGKKEESTQARHTVSYKVLKKDGTLVQMGFTDSHGQSARFFTHDAEELNVYIGTGEWEVTVDAKHPVVKTNTSLDKGNS